MAIELHIDIDTVLRDLENMRLERAVEKEQFRRIVRKELSVARRNLIKEARRVLEHDPRQAYKGVKMMVYRRKALGGNIAILEPKGKTLISDWKKPRKVRSSKIGGNRVKPHPDYTVRRDSYWGASRAFVLRFVNSGTNIREAGRFSNNFKGANRGRITKNLGWFERAADREAAAAVDRIKDEITAEVVREYERKK